MDFHFDVCPECDGRGVLYADGWGIEECPPCGGTGEDRMTLVFKREDAA